MFLDKAEMVGDILEFAYGDSKLQEKTHGLPYGEINPAKGYVQQHGWAGGCFVLAEFGTILLEWTTLSYETGEPRYGKHATDVNAYLRSLKLINFLRSNIRNGFGMRFFRDPDSQIPISKIRAFNFALKIPGS